MNEPEIKAALDRLPPGLHGLLFWLLTGRQPTPSARNGAA